MPYIDKVARKPIDEVVETLYPLITDEGELNYVVTRLCTMYLGKSPHYAALNTVVGVLACAQQELYRRRVVPYEKLKQFINGDVY